VFEQSLRRAKNCSKVWSAGAFRDFIDNLDCIREFVAIGAFFANKEWIRVPCHCLLDPAADLTERRVDVSFVFRLGIEVLRRTLFELIDNARYHSRSFPMHSIELCLVQGTRDRERRNRAIVNAENAGW